MADQQVRDQIIDLVAEISGEDEVKEPENQDVDLFEAEVFDSFAAIQFLVEVKDRFGVSIAPTELEREEMNTVNKIVARITERM
ncbi:MAG: D-alanine--poly(phosphoribitol) ligase subunit DltC [Coriobacteriales bacterium]|nr:D-alanine--poly(phosphoribitol) ligase subunit DltC [Coriobacteriales bacterium]